MKNFFKLLIFTLTAIVQTSQAQAPTLNDILIACKTYQLKVLARIEGVKADFYEAGYIIGSDPLKYAELFAESYARLQLIALHNVMMKMDQESPLVPLFIKNVLLSHVLKNNDYAEPSQKAAGHYHACLIEHNIHGTNLGNRKVPFDCQFLQNEFLKAARHLGMRELQKNNF